MTLRDTLSWNLLEGWTGWGLVVVVLLISVLGITASVEKWIDPPRRQHVPHRVLVYREHPLNSLYTPHSPEHREGQIIGRSYPIPERGRAGRNYQAFALHTFCTHRW